MQKTPGAKVLEGFGIFMMVVIVALGAGMVYLGVVEFSVLTRFPKPVSLSYEDFVARHPREGWYQISGAATNLNEAAWEENIGSGKVTRVFLPLHSLRNPLGGQIKVLLETKDPSILEFVEQKKQHASPGPGMGFSPFQAGFGGAAPSLEGTVSTSLQAPVMASRFKQAHVTLPGGLAPDYIYFNSGNSPSLGKAAVLSGFGMVLIVSLGFLLYKVVQEKRMRG